MQIRNLLDTPPIPPIQRILADKIQGPGDHLAVFLCHHQQDVFSHAGTNLVKKGFRQIGPAPFFFDGCQIKLVKSIPVI